MRTRVLARIHQAKDEWDALAYQGEATFCRARGLSEANAVEKLKEKVEETIAVQGRAWLEQWRHAGRPGASNCPEGAVKLPIDLWVCKLAGETCPIQAQVFLDEPERFFRHCLAPQARKHQIFDTVAKGEYDGFHHVPDRYLCVWCEHEGKEMNFRYHYPWELTHLEAYYPFVLERDWPRFRVRLRSKGMGLSAVSNALCATHCKEVAEQLDPALAAELTVLEFELSR